MIDLVERPELVHAGVERMVDAWMVELDQFVEQNLLAVDCQQHAHRLRRLRLHQQAAGPGPRSQLRQAAQHVGLLERPDFLRGLAGDALGVRRQARSALARALGHDLLRLLRAAGPEDRDPAPDSQPAQDLRQPLVQDRPAGREGRAPTTCSAASPIPRSSPTTAGTPSGRGRTCAAFSRRPAGCHVELIMKDISTVRYHPKRLWEWAAIAMEVAEEFAV